jgi:hypothetical protein
VADVPSGRSLTPPHETYVMTVSKSDYRASNDWKIMNSQMEMCKEVVVVQFKVLSWHLPGGSHENQENFRKPALPTEILSLACSVFSD